jgi:hypothetical protein
MTPEEETQQAKINALNTLKQAGLFDSATDNPQNLNLATPSPTPVNNPAATMQQNPTNLVNALQGTSREQQLQDLLKQAK